VNLRFRVRIHTFPRAVIPAHRSLESELLVRLAQAVERGAPIGGAGLVVRAQTVDQIDLGDAFARGLSVQAAMGSFARTTTDAGGGVEALGWFGRIEAPRPAGRGRVACAAVFLEWEDCRWWLWTARLGEGGVGWHLDTAAERSALEGDALPPGLGRYWTWARRTRQQPRHLAATAPLGAAVPGVH
jgi:hypothetical protein